MRHEDIWNFQMKEDNGKPIIQSHKKTEKRITNFKKKLQKAEKKAPDRSARNITGKSLNHIADKYYCPSGDNAAMKTNYLVY